MIGIRILQIDGQAQVRIFPDKPEGFQVYNLSPPQLVSLAQQALKAYIEIEARDYAHAPNRNHR